MSTSHGAARQSTITSPRRQAAAGRTLSPPPLFRQSSPRRSEFPASRTPESEFPPAWLDARSPQALPSALELPAVDDGHTQSPIPLSTYRPFGRSELDAAWARWAEYDHVLADSMLLIAHTGLRWREARALSVTDLAPHVNQIVVTAQRRDDGSVVSSSQAPSVRTPSARVRRIPICLRIRQAARALAERAGSGGLLLTDGLGNPLQRAAVARALDWPRTAPGHRLADLRITAPTLWTADGIPASVVSEWMGLGSIRH